SVLAISGRVIRVLLNVQPDSGTLRASTGEADDNPGAILEFDKETLVLAHAAVEIGVREVVGLDHLDILAANGDGRALEGRIFHLLAEASNKLLGTLAVDVFVVVASKEGAAILLPEFVLNAGNRGLFAFGQRRGNTSNNVEPGNNCPKTVLLTDVVGSSAERLFTANRKLLCVKQSAEELPA